VLLFRYAAFRQPLKLAPCALYLLSLNNYFPHTPALVFLVLAALALLFGALGSLLKGRLFLTQREG